MLGKIFDISEFASYFLLKNTDRIQFLRKRETLEYALQYSHSITRFGDGEFSIVLRGKDPGYKGIHFQKADSLLYERLAEILYRPIPNVLVCINHEFMRNDEWKVVLDYERSQKDYVRHETVHRHNDIAVMLRHKQRINYLKQFFLIRKKTSISHFGEATCFMLCFYYDEYVRARHLEIIDLYRRFFSNRRILFVCPETPHMGLSLRKLHESGFIKSAKSVDYLNTPEKNCFSYYSEIKKRILSFQGIEAVFIQGGPTATVLAAELTEKHNILCYDIGSWNVSLQKAASVHHISF